MFLSSFSLQKAGKQLLVACALFLAYNAQAQVSEKPKGATSPLYTSVAQDVPEFTGGQELLQQFINENLRDPYKARTKGKVLVRFIVGRDGAIRDAKVTHSMKDCPECDAEAVRLVESMPDWIAGEQNGNKIDFYYTLPIPFRAYDHYGDKALPVPYYSGLDPYEIPVPRCGMKELYDFLQAQLQYPQNAQQNGIEGKVYIRFLVEKNGDISDAKVVRGLRDCPECDAEAMRLVKLMPKWEASKRNGIRNASYFTLRIDFRLKK